MKIKDLSSSLNRRVSIEESVITPDGFGGQITEWQKVKTIWADIIPINQVDYFEGNRIEERVTHLIRVRYTKNFRTSYRINYNGRIFNINSIINIGENNEILEIKVEEVL